MSFLTKKKEVPYVPPAPVASPDPKPPVKPAPPPLTPDERFRKALELTGSFEGKGFDQVTGDFDRQGLSCGILQWCFGQGSLQASILRPYIATFGSIDLLGIFPEKVDHLAIASVPSALTFARAHMLEGVHVKPHWKAAWEKFLKREDTIQIQMKAASHDRDIANNMMHSLGLDSDRAFMWCFDIVTQNGSMKGIQLQAPDRALAKRELAARDAKGGVADFHKNKVIWAEMLSTVSDEQVALFRTTLRRALVANPDFTADVINRKGSIAMGRGWVHGNLVKV